MNKGTAKISGGRCVCTACEKQFEDTKSMWDHRGKDHPKTLKQRMASYDSLTRENSIILKKIDSMLNRFPSKKKSEQTPQFGNTVISKHSSLVQRSRNKNSFTESSEGLTFAASSGARLLGDNHSLKKSSYTREVVNKQYQEMQVKQASGISSLNKQIKDSFNLRRTQQQKYGQKK